MLAGAVEPQPVFDCLRQVRVFGREIERVLARHLAKDRNVTRNDRQAVPRGFNQRQTETFAFGLRDEAGRGGVDFFQILIGRSVQPKQALAALVMRWQPRCDLRDGAAHVPRQAAPAFSTDDNQIDVHGFAPKPIESVEHRQMPFARLNGADLKKTWTRSEGFKIMWRVLRKATCRSGIGNVCTRPEMADVE